MRLTPPRAAARRLLLALIALAALAAGPGAGIAASSDPHVSTPLQARLVTAEDGVAPGTTGLSAGLDMTLAEGWKTYWRSPGEVGLPPEIDWEGSTNVASVEILWPAPTRFRAFGIENFGYKHEVVLPLRVTLERPGEPAALRAAVSMLVCSDVCVPENFALALDLPRGGGIDPVAAERIAAYAGRVPAETPPDLAVEAASLDDEALTLRLAGGRDFAGADVFPERDGASFGTPDIRPADGAVWARFPVLAPGEGPVQVTVTGADRPATLAAPLGPAAPAPPYVEDATGAGLGELAWIALVAVLGGLILNVMPCVLPVLSIKLASAMQAGGQDRARVRRGFIVTALGVLAFMWALAAATLAARGLGLTGGLGHAVPATPSS